MSKINPFKLQAKYEKAARSNTNNKTTQTKTSPDNGGIQLNNEAVRSVEQLEKELAEERVKLDHKIVELFACYKNYSVAFQSLFNEVHKQSKNEKL